MRRAAVCSATFFLPIQPLGQASFEDDFHVYQDALPVRVLRICHELAHESAGTQFTALIAEFKTFTLGASLDTAGGSIPGGFLTLASVALLIPIYFSCLCG
jgi:hypothetical protein